MRVTLQHTDQITTELDVQSIKWCSADSKEVGVAQLRVPHNHPAFDRRYISEDKGSTIQIVDDELGRWNGIVVRTRFVDDGAAVELTCHDRRALFSGLPTGRQRFRLTTAGAIVRAAFRQAVGARPRVGLVEGEFTESAPLIPEYEIERDSFRDVLSTMQERSSQEWYIDEDGAFHWVARQGRLKSKPLVQGRDLYSVEWETGVIDRVSEVIAVGEQGDELRLIAPELADGGFWVSRIISSSGDSEDMERRALRILEDQRHAVPNVNLQLARHTWADIREGDIMRFVIPSAGFRGDSPAVRIQTREYSGRDGQLTVNLDVLPRVSAEELQ